MHKEDVTMKKTLRFMLVFVIIISLLSAMVGCGAKNATDSSRVERQSNNAGEDTDAGNFGGETARSASEQSSPESAEAPATDPTLNLANINTQALQDILGDRKIIFNAFIVLDVEEFDTKFKMITSMVESTGIGYVQNSEITSHKISSNPEIYRKSGTIVLRVAQNKFNTVVNDIQQLGTVRDYRRGTEEITDQYYDTQYWVQAYEAERERIMEYLRQAPNLDQMLTLERKLSEVTYKIEKLKGSLRKWDNLVEFTTITIELREASADGTKSFNRSKDYGQRLAAAFADSFTGAIETFGNFLINIIYILPTLIVLGIVYLIARPWIKKFVRKSKTLNKDIDSN